MLKINNVKLGLDEPEAVLAQKAAKILEIGERDIQKLQIIKKSVDARKKGDVHFVYTLGIQTEDEPLILKRNKDVSACPESKYQFPLENKKPKTRPVIVGAGPAGLFCALMLARAGAKPILLERGLPIEKRTADVAGFWSGGMLNPSSNVQFGEGGAGTFSDGKLTTGIHDPRLGFVLQEFVKAGGPEDILYLAKPHLGTDKLSAIVSNMRKEIIAQGGDVRFEHRLSGISEKAGQVYEVGVQTPEGFYTMSAEHLVLAIGHSARDTFELLYQKGFSMEQKNFAVGVRIEHLQRGIDKAQYGELAGHPSLPPADYKLSCHLPVGRSVFSFCVCPGGVVVAAASEPGRLVTNGMSRYARDGENINGGLLVNIGPGDFESNHPLSGIAFQRKLEEAAFLQGGGNYFAPVQKTGDFLNGVPSKFPGTVLPTYSPGVTPGILPLPGFVSDALKEAIPLLDRKLPGFAHPDGILTAVESRSSSPVRIHRDESLQANIRVVYPCGEGAGYAGGIMSAAVDGIKCAEMVYRAL